ncbi:TrpB-like pyridoxal phosphate-dependent enzyme [Streptomyces sp. NBC_01167]|uniref:TrpB-like pyridoxal phosphate-dependent enzyme n=1 Tax=Streptomyces sp. NBC_01167 TaxID=2903756 RepID=UPI00386594A1|nr:TrpB-like pyridoxal phosphate-dependent enzyme [Streptomyces sp. NBC_01167]
MSSNAQVRIDAECGAQSAATSIPLPTHWYHFLPDLPVALPPVKDELTPSAAEVAQRVRPAALLAQDRPADQWVPIPEPVADRLRHIGRPTPLHRARALESALGTGAHIYLKREDVLPTGSFKLNSAVAQAYYAAEEGRTTLISETGAGQWGMSVALAAALLGLDSEVFMVRCSLAQKPYRRHYMELLGATVHASPSPDTKFGQQLLARNPEHPGSLGTAISDAIQFALDFGPGAAYLSGSGVPHVYLHQTLLGLEVQAQLAALEEPIGVPGRGDHLIACSGGGSNLCGLVGPFLKQAGDQGRDLRLLAAESTAAPRLTAGRYQYGRSDLAGLTPEVLGYSMGPDFVPPPVHTAGLRNHHSSSTVSLLRHEGLLDAVAIEEKRALEAGRLVLRTEGFLLAPESTHAVAAAIEVATRAKEADTDPVLVVLASGSGLLDLQSYGEVLLGSGR